MTTPSSFFRSAPRLLLQTAKDWMENNALRLSAALAYYSVFSIAPLLVLSVGLAGWFFGAEAARGHLDDQLQGLVGAEPAKAVQTMVQSTSQPAKSLAATIIGLVTLLVGASGVFGQLKDALNTIWGVKPKPGPGWKLFLRERLLSFGMVLVIGFLLLTSFLLTTLLSAFNEWMEVILQLPQWVWGGAGMLISLAVITVLFALIFKVLPDAKIAWQHVWIGAAATALLFEIGKFGLAYYLGRESTASSFGAAGSVVLLLLWVYYASCILLFGAEFTKVYAVAHGAVLQPSESAEPLTAETRAREGMTPHPALAPPREQLAVVLPPPAPPPTRFPKHWTEVFPFLKEHMAVGILGAAGLGWAAGTASRLVQRDPQRDPAQEIRRSSGLLGTALILLFSRSFRSALHKSALTVSSRRWPWLHRLLANA